MAITTFRLSSAPRQATSFGHRLERSPTTDPLELAHPPALARGGNNCYRFSRSRTKLSNRHQRNSNGAVTAPRWRRLRLATRLLPPVPWLREHRRWRRPLRPRSTQLDHSRELSFTKSQMEAARSLATECLSRWCRPTGSRFAKTNTYFPTLVIADVTVGQAEAARHRLSARAQSPTTLPPIPPTDGCLHSGANFTPFATTVVWRS